MGQGYSVVLLTILRDGIAPVFLLIGCGYVLDKAFKLDMHTLVPPSVNTVLLAIELDNRPDYAANAVFFSTLLSGLTVAVAIYLVHMLG